MMLFFVFKYSSMVSSELVIRPQKAAKKKRNGLEMYTYTLSDLFQIKTETCSMHLYSASLFLEYVELSNYLIFNLIHHRAAVN